MSGCCSFGGETSIVSQYFFVLMVSAPQRFVNNEYSFDNTEGNFKSVFDPNHLFDF